MASARERTIPTETDTWMLNPALSNPVTAAAAAQQRARAVSFDSYNSSPIRFGIITDVGNIMEAAKA